MSGIREMIETVREEFSASDYQYPMAKMDRKIEILVDVVISMEGVTRRFEKRIADLELSLEMKGRIIDTLCEQLGKMEDFQARTEPCINTLSREVGVLERKQAKAADEHVIVSTNIDTLFRANVDRNKEYQKLTEKYNREFAECNKDILGTHMTLMKYKRENEMLDNRISDLYAENQSRDNGLELLRIKLIDVLDEVEKNTSEAAEIKRMAIDIHSKHKEYDRNFGATMTRMNELEEAMKTVTIHWSDIRLMKEKLGL